MEDDPVGGESVKAMTYYELVDAMLNRHAVWFWYNMEPCYSGMDFIDSDGVVHLESGIVKNKDDLFATKLDLVKTHFDRIQKMLDEEERKKISSFDGDLDEFEEDNE